MGSLYCKFVGICGKKHTVNAYIICYAVFFVSFFYSGGYQEFIASTADTYTAFFGPFGVVGVGFYPFTLFFVPGFNIESVTVSYISRFFTLKTGDLIFTGTPAGVGPVHIDDHLEGWLEEEKVLEFNVK